MCTGGGRISSRWQKMGSAKLFICSCVVNALLCVVVEKQGQGGVVGRAPPSGRSAEEVRKKRGAAQLNRCGRSAEVKVRKKFGRSPEEEVRKKCGGGGSKCGTLRRKCGAAAEAAKKEEDERPCEGGFKKILVVTGRLLPVRATPARRSAKCTVDSRTSKPTEGKVPPASLPPFGSSLLTPNNWPINKEKKSGRTPRGRVYD